MNWILIAAIISVWLAVCFVAWALVRAGDLADQRTKKVKRKENKNVEKFPSAR